jgi:hypothetical protein
LEELQVETPVQVWKSIAILKSLLYCPQQDFNIVVSTDSELLLLLSGAAMFDAEYNRWLDDDSRRMVELRGGLHAHLPDGDLRAIIDDSLNHYDELFRLKGAAARTDVFHLITGMWATPAERCFLWMGGFRPSDLLKACLPNYTES